MSTGANLGTLGTASVNVTADLSSLDEKLKAAESKIRAQMVRNEQAMRNLRPIALSTDPADALARKAAIDATVRLMDANEQLRAKLEAVRHAATRAAEAVTGGAAGATSRTSANAAATAARATAEAEKAKAESRRILAYRTQVIGQTMDDLQYVETMGLRPILNNIMAISPQVGIAMLSADLIVKKTVGSWGKLFEMLGYAPLKTTIETIQARIEVLNNKRVKIGVDYNELDTLQKKLEKLQKAKEAFEGSKEDTYTKGLSKEAKDLAGGMPGGSEALEKAVAEMESSEGRTRMTQEQMQKIADRYLGHPEKVKEAIELEAGKMDREFAKEEVGKMLAGDADAIERMKNRAARNPGAFTAKDMSGNTAAEAIARLPKTKEEFRKREADKAQDKLMADFEKHERDLGEQVQHKAESDAAPVAKALEEVFARELLKSIKTGASAHGMDKEVAASLEAAGMDSAKAKKMAYDVVEGMLKSMEEKVRDKALAEGISRGDAATKVDADVRKAQREKADKAMGISDFKPEVTSIDSFFNSLLTRTPAKDEGTDKIVKAVDEGTKATQALGKVMGDRLSDRRAKYAR
jgi:hypothetical protein